MVAKEKLEELEKRFDFLTRLIEEVNGDITDIQVNPKSEIPSGSALDSHYDSGYDYWTNVRNFGNVVVHEYWTKDSKNVEDVELVIYVEGQPPKDSANGDVKKHTIHFACTYPDEPGCGCPDNDFHATHEFEGTYEDALKEAARLNHEKYFGDFKWWIT